MLWVPDKELQNLLEKVMTGISLKGLPLRTRSKVVKSKVCESLGYPIPSNFTKSKPRFPGAIIRVIFLAIVATVSISAVRAEILWDGSFVNGDYNAWPWREPGNIAFFGMNTATRPIRYSAEQSMTDQIGNGKQAGIVHATGTTIAKSFGNVTYPAGPVRTGSFAGRFTVENSVNGSEPESCGESDNGKCTYRRSEVWTWGGREHNYMAHYLNAWPQFETRWFTQSVYIPASFPMASGSGFWPICLQIKPRWGGYAMSPTFALAMHPTQGWRIIHRTHPEIAKNLVQHGLTVSGCYNYNTSHDTEYRSTTGIGYKDYLAVDFPDATASRAALASLDQGTWTDWVFQLKTDPRGPNESGTGFLKAWKRVGAGAWVQVLDIIPREFTVSGYTLKRGVFFNDPGANDGTNANLAKFPANWTSTLVNQSGTFYSEQNGGFCVMAGFYGSKSYFWDASANVSIYLDNMKVGSSNATFANMSPDGSSPA